MALTHLLDISPSSYMDSLSTVLHPVLYPRESDLYGLHEKAPLSFGSQQWTMWSGNFPPSLFSAVSPDADRVSSPKVPER